MLPVAVLVVGPYLLEKPVRVDVVVVGITLEFPA